MILWTKSRCKLGCDYSHLFEHSNTLTGSPRTPVRPTGPCEPLSPGRPRGPISPHGPMLPWIPWKTKKDTKTNKQNMLISFKYELKIKLSRKTNINGYGETLKILGNVLQSVLRILVVQEFPFHPGRQKMIRRLDQMLNKVEWRP